MRLRVPFSDVDMHGNMHNGRYVAYAEDAVNEFLREAGLSALFDPASSRAAYHVKKVEVVYERPLRFGDPAEIAAHVARIGRTSLTFAVVARNEEAPEGAAAARAEVVWVCVDPNTRRPVPVPEPTAAALRAASRPEDGGDGAHGRPDSATAQDGQGRP
ncbi:thioesterase family protein [Nocardiopsis sp. RSe5-2]|uniref:Thioesterase family protein n=1 Tax=Nocardiopsis endophytica TaxID=3018445 RepID=A0ABT4U5Y9_9ACTN|nr:thioesterase family protein [Nocardiopsis endophytica]MDA2812355.1 thioesterase family protein [Nocardiopsis endophytica]